MHLVLSLPDFCGGDSAAPQEFAVSSSSADVQGEKSCRPFQILDVLGVDWRISARCLFTVYDWSSGTG